MSEAAISVRELRKSYGEHEAVAGIEFEVAAGEVFGFLGPNGAGKTMTIEILVLVLWLAPRSRRDAFAGNSRRALHSYLN